MEALAAFSFAANVIQFAQTTSTVVCLVRNVYNSTSGNSDDVKTINETYGTLQRLHAGLMEGNHSVEARDTTTSQEDERLVAFATTCEAKCSQLVELAGKLNVTGRGKLRWARAIRVVAFIFWLEPYVKSLEKEINEIQMSMVLLISDLTRTGVARLLAELRNIKAQTKTFGDEFHGQVENICQHVSEIGYAIEGIQTQHATLASRIKELEIQIQKAAAAGLRSQSVVVEQAVLKSLDYDCRPSRLHSIHPAHKLTFEWVYSSSSNGKSKSHRFLEWLEKGDGLFWIRGKAGAGKSTLMKFIAGDSRTERTLQTWAKPAQHFVGSHYLWSSGSIMQKSYRGLLRSLLFDIISNLPRLITPICHEEAWWPSLVGHDHPETVPKWSEASLLGCLRKLATAENLHDSVKFCLFIDGLDEYDGHVNGEAKDFIGMCRTLLELTVSARMKICVSSRPENVFHDHFGEDLSRILDVQELTAQDMMRYARDELIDLNWGRLALGKLGETPVQLLESFVHQIQQQSQGVFLWVFLVVRLIRDGFTNEDSFQELQHRLNSLPSDLEPFLKRMLESVKPHYHQKMASFLRITMASRHMGLPMYVYTAHENEYDPSRPPVDEVYCGNTGDEDSERLQTRMNQNKRLYAITHGLLEINRDDYVHFLHRTVADFLKTEQMMKFLLDKSHQDFTPCIAILRAYLANWKVPSHASFRSELARFWESSGDTLHHLLCYIRYPLSYVPEAFLEDRLQTTLLLDQLEIVSQRLVLSLVPLIWRDIHRFQDEQEHPHHPVLRACRLDVASYTIRFMELKGDVLAISSMIFRSTLLLSHMEAHTVDYLVSKLEQDPEYLRGLPESPLVDLVHHHFQVRAPQDELLRLGRLLLGLRYNPDQPTRYPDAYQDEARLPPYYNTPWRELLRLVGKYLDSANGHHWITLFLKFGADLNVSVRCGRVKYEPQDRDNPLLPAWATICLSPFRNPSQPIREPEEYMKIVQVILSARSDIGLFINSDASNSWDFDKDGRAERTSGWMILRHALGRLQRGDESISRLSLEIHSPVLFELAKAEEVDGREKFPWYQIKTVLKDIYTAQLLKPLFSLIKGKRLFNQPEDPSVYEVGGLEEGTKS